MTKKLFDVSFLLACAVCLGLVVGDLQLGEVGTRAFAVLVLLGGTWAFFSERRRR